MTFKESLLSVLKEYQEKQFFGNQSRAAESLGMTQSSWNRWMSDDGFNPRLNTLAEAMDTLGVIAVREPDPENAAQTLASLDEGPALELTHQRQLVEILKAECEKKDAIIEKLFDVIRSQRKEKGDAFESRSA